MRFRKYIQKKFLNYFRKYYAEGDSESLTIL